MRNNEPSSSLELPNFENFDLYQCWETKIYIDPSKINKPGQWGMYISDNSLYTKTLDGSSFIEYSFANDSDTTYSASSEWNGSLKYIDQEWQVKKVSILDNGWSYWKNIRIDDFPNDQFNLKKEHEKSDLEVKIYQAESLWWVEYLLGLEWLEVPQWHEIVFHSTFERPGEKSFEVVVTSEEPQEHDIWHPHYHKVISKKCSAFIKYSKWDNTTTFIKIPDEDLITTDNKISAWEPGNVWGHEVRWDISTDWVYDGFDEDDIPSFSVLPYRFSIRWSGSDLSEETNQHAKWQMKWKFNDDVSTENMAHTDRFHYTNPALRKAMRDIEDEKRSSAPNIAAYNARIKQIKDLKWELDTATEDKKPVILERIQELKLTHQALSQGGINAFIEDNWTQRVKLDNPKPERPQREWPYLQKTDDYSYNSRV